MRCCISIHGGLVIRLSDLRMGAFLHGHGLAETEGFDALLRHGGADRMVRRSEKGPAGLPVNAGILDQARYKM